jgi:hypothetical protein
LIRELIFVPESGLLVIVSVSAAESIDLLVRVCVPLVVTNVLGKGATLQTPALTLGYPVAALVFMPVPPIDAANCVDVPSRDKLDVIITLFAASPVTALDGKLVNVLDVPLIVLLVSVCAAVLVVTVSELTDNAEKLGVAVDLTS